MDQAKRIILRLRDADFNHSDPFESVRLFLEKKGRPIEELKDGRHFIHVQPSNPDIPQVDAKIHIIIDMEVDQFSGILDEGFPHEVYRIQRLDNRLTISAYRDGLWYANFIRKLRSITDELYPWGMTRMDESRKNTVNQHSSTAFD